MCSNNSDSTFSSALVWPVLLGWALLLSASTVQATHLRLWNTRPRYERLRTPLLKHHIETLRTNVIELRPRRPIVQRRGNWLTR